MNKDLLIIIPAYNESDNISNVLDRLKDEELSKIADILVVDDGSTDDTVDVVAKQGVQVLKSVLNMGYGSAVQLGYKYAKEHEYEYVIQMDADGQHDVANVRPIYETLMAHKADIVIGSRFLSEESTMRVKGVKKWVILFFRLIIKVFTKQVITDPTSGLQGLNKKTFCYYAEYNHFDYKYPDINMIIQMLMLGYHIIEVPAIMHERAKGESMHTGIFKQLRYMAIIMLSTLSIILRNRKASK